MTVALGARWCEQRERSREHAGEASTAAAAGGDETNATAMIGRNIGDGRGISIADATRGAVC